MAEKQPEQPAEMAPDPDEDDLDDLDDVLDEFQSTTISGTTKPKPPPASTTATAPAASGPGRPSDSAAEPASGEEAGALPSDEEFSRQLQAGVQNLMSELDGNPAMQKQFEEMMAELLAAGAAGTNEAAAEHIGRATERVVSPSGTGRSDAGAAGAGSKDEKFQSTIRKTMERMQASGDAATTAAERGTAAAPEDDLLAQLMKDLADAGGDGGESFNSMLLNMMAQLTHKEILYEPMKELHDKFPAWMAQNRATTSQDDLARYDEQQKLVGQIVARFERPGYSDDHADDREYIVEKMQLMQAAGSPPADLVGDMTAAQEALGELDGCPTQ